MYQSECGFEPGDVILAARRSPVGIFFFRVVFEVDDNGDKDLAALGLGGSYRDEVVPMLWLMEGGEFDSIGRASPTH